MTLEQREKIAEIVRLTYYGDGEFVPFCENRKEWLQRELESLVCGCH